jgi:hypothetical protein
VGLERRPISLLSTTEELLGRKSSGSGLKNREYERGDLLRSPRDTLYLQKLALTSLTSGGRSVGIVNSRTKERIFSVIIFIDNNRPKQFTDLIIISQVKLLPIQYLLLIKYKLLH